MKRYFVCFDDHTKVYVDRKFNLSDEDLVIKRINQDGSTSFEDIVATQSRFKNDQVEEYNQMLQNKRSEIYIKIPIDDLDKITDGCLLTYFEAKENTYFQEGVEFSPRNIKLIDYGAFHKVPTNTEVVVVLPSPIENGKLQISTTSSVLTLSGSSSYARRQALRKIYLGSDLYLHTDDEEVLDECRTWITEMTEEKYGIFSIHKKHHIIYKPLSTQERLSLPKEYGQIFENLMKYGANVYITRDPVMIYLPDSTKIPPTADPVFLLRREDIEPLIKEGFDKIPFAAHFSVVVQTNEDMVITTLEDAFDIPKTVIEEEKEIKQIKIEQAKKLDLFYEHNPNNELPKILRGLPVVEFEGVDTDNNGNVIWEKQERPFQVETNEEYYERLLSSGNRCFVEIKGPSEEEIIKELGPKGSLQEFEVYKYPDGENSSIEYYVSRAFMPY